MKKHMNGISDAWLGFMKFYACVAVFFSFSNTYIVTFLKRATGSDGDTMLYNLSQLAIQPFAMLAAVWLMRKKSALFSQRIGLALYALVFLAFCAGGEDISRHYMWIGGAISAANGFFYTTYALQLLAYANDENRDASYGLQSMLGSVISLTLPLLSSLLVAGFSDFTGYRILFGACFGVSALSMYFSTQLAPLTNVTPGVHLGKALRVLAKDPSARAAMGATTIGGFYSGSISFFITLLLYSAAGDERTVGLSATVCGVISILAGGAYMRLMRPSRRGPAIAVSLTALILAAAPMLFRVSVGTLLAYSFASAALTPFIFNPPLTAYLGVVERLDELRGLGSEVHALREFCLKVGQIGGTLLTMLLANMKNGAAVIIILILATQYATVPLIRMMVGGREKAPQDG